MATLAAAARETIRKNPKLPQLPALTSIRYFFALVVVCVHYRGLLTPQIGEEIIFQGIGTAAVTAFFVLSGFILTYQYWKPDTAINNGRFYIARVARIVPVYWLSLIVALLIKSHFQLPAADKLPGIFALTALFLHGWTASAPIILAINTPTYTLCIEAFFYAIFPFVIGHFARRPFLALLVSLVASFSTFVVSPDSHLWAALICPIGRLSEFAFGIVSGLLFLQWRERAQSWSVPAVTLFEVVSLVGCLLFIGVTAHTYNFPTAYLYDSLLKSTVAMLMAIALFPLALNRGMVARLWSWAPLVLLGEVSYSLYLLHDLFLHYLKAQNLNVPWTNPLYLLGFAAGATFISYLCFKFVEAPWRAKILAWKKTPLSPLLRCQLGVIAALLLVRGFVETSWWHEIQIANSTPIVSSSVTFQDGATLDRMYMLRLPEGIEFTSYWRSGTNPKRARRVGVHMLNSKGEILKQFDHDLMPTPFPLSGTEVKDRFAVAPQDLRNVTCMGLAVFDDPNETVPIEGGTCDWGNHRLLVPIKN